MKKTFALVAVGLILLTFATPVAGLEIWEYSTTSEFVRIMYEDGTYGNIPINTTDYVFDNWVNYYTVDDAGTEIYNETITQGVQFGAFFENEANVKGANDESITSTHKMYELGVFPPEGYSFKETTAIPLTQHYMKLSSSKIMNGLQEAWYRSPIKWSADYEIYRINIWDTETNTLVYVGEVGKAYGGISARDMGMIVDDRIYIKLNFRFLSNVKYRIIEGVNTVDNNPISSVDLFFANNQDIGDDGLTDSFVFPTTNQSRKFENIELSWSLCATIGIGEAGTEKLVSLSNLVSGPNRRVELESHYIYGAVNDVDYINITVPFRFNKPTNISFVVLTYGHHTAPDGTYDLASASVTVERTLYNVTGMFRATVPITDNDPAKTNSYKIIFRFYDVKEDHYMTYPMVPAENTFHKLYAAGAGYKLIAMPHFAMHIELEEGTVPEDYVDQSIYWKDVLVGTLLIIAGVIAFAVALTSGSIPLLFVGIGLIAGGAYKVTVGLGWVTPGETTMGDILRGFGDGVVRLARTVWSGITWVGEALWDAAIWVVEKVQMVAAGLWFALEAIFDFMFLILFMAVVWFWAKFLKIMDGIVAGDMDKALATTQQMITTPMRVVRRYRPRRLRRRR